MNAHPAVSSVAQAAGVVVRLTPRVAVYEDRGRYLPPRRYEDEGSERTSTGAIYLTSHAAWKATLSVPLPDADAVFLRVERTGPLPDQYRGAEESAVLSIPVDELEAVLGVLAGVIAQARRDGVLG